MSRRAFAVCVVAGSLLRAAALPLPGTPDVRLWQVWTYSAATQGATRVYGVGGSPPERRLLRYAGMTATVDYPPLVLYELEVAGLLYEAVAPGFPRTILLTAFIKLTAIMAEAAMLALLVAALPALGVADGTARAAAALFWLNPAFLLGGACLGYLDPLFGLPLLGAFVAAGLGWPALAGVLAAAAVLTKAQGVFVLPAVALLAVRRRGPMALARGAGGGLTAALLIIGPVVAAGALPNLLQALESLTRHDMLSGYASNVWWIVTYLYRASYAAEAFGAWTAYTMPVERILAVSTMIELSAFDPRPWGQAAVVAVWAWAMWRVWSSRDVFLLVGLGAFMVHTYFMLAVQVHENHLYAGVVLLTLAAAGRPTLRPVLASVSVIVALNLNLFYGLGDGIGYAIPRTLTGLDASVLLALVHVGVYLWHARVFSALVRSDTCGKTPAPLGLGSPEGLSTPGAAPS